MAEHIANSDIRIKTEEHDNDGNDQLVPTEDELTNSRDFKDTSGIRKPACEQNRFGKTKIATDDFHTGITKKVSNYVHESRNTDVLVNGNIIPIVFSHAGNGIGSRSKCVLQANDYETLLDHEKTHETMDLLAEVKMEVKPMLDDTGGIIDRNGTPNDVINGNMITTAHSSSIGNNPNYDTHNWKHVFVKLERLDVNTFGHLQYNVRLCLQNSNTDQSAKPSAAAENSTGLELQHKMVSALSYRASSLSYECGRCAFISYRFLDALDHITVKHKHKALNCFCCNFSTNTIVDMRTHLDNHIQNSHLPQLKLHVKQTSNNEHYQCVNCAYSTKFMETLNDHYFTVHIKKLLLCITCKTQFHFESQFKSHLKITHPESFEENEQASNDIFNTVTPYKCLHCNYYTDNKSQFCHHVVSHNSARINGTTPSQDNFCNLSKTVPTFHRCNYCEYYSSSKKYLNDHIRIKHSNKQKFVKCDLCQNYYKNSLTLKRHITKMHEQNNKVHCMHCEFTTIHMISLETHMQYHTGELTQLCYVCGYRNPHKGYMDQHIKQHFGLRNYSCNLCEYKTAVRAHLTKHMNIHSHERAYVCSVCGHDFKSKYNLQVHMVSHATNNKLFSCNLCDYKGMLGWRLTKHMKTHSDNRQLYKCSKCSITFTTKWSLSQHVSAHDGIKPFICRSCPFKTARPNSLQAHERMHSDLCKMYCFKCKYSSTHRANFILHVNRTCSKARPNIESLRYCYHCGHTSSHRSNFINHVNRGCNTLKAMRKKEKL